MTRATPKTNPKTVKTPRNAAGGVPAFIYALCCPETGEVRYIGKANNPEKRLKTHLRDARTRNTPVYLWIRKLQRSELAPSMRVIEKTNDWAEAEKRIIADYRKSNKLLNVADGGDEPSCPSTVRASNGRKNARLVHDNPYKRKVWELKHKMCLILSSFVKNGEVEAEYRQRLKMRKLAAIRPDICADWAAI